MLACTTNGQLYTRQLPDESGVWEGGQYQHCSSVTMEHDFHHDAGKHSDRANQKTAEVVQKDVLGTDLR